MRRAWIVSSLAAVGLASACGGGGDDAASTPDGSTYAGGDPNGGGSSSGGASSGGGPAGADGGAHGTPYVDFDVNHVLVTGQSNSVANGGTPVLSTTQPFANLMFDTGVMSMRGQPSDATLGCNDEGCTTYETPKSLVPLVEGDRYYDYAVETAASGLANEVSFLATTKLGRPKHDVLVSLHGRSGNTYWCLRKPVDPAPTPTSSSCNYKTGYLEPFRQAMMEVESAKALAASAKKSYVVRAVAAIHGESDDYAAATGTSEFPLDGHDGTPHAIADYSDALVEWQKDYESSVAAITGQTTPVPLFVSQISGWNYAPARSAVAQNQLDAHIKAPGKVVLIGPSYHLPLIQTECIHFTNEGERRLGEYFAKVYARVVLEGGTWEPVRPKTVTRANDVVTVQFHVPKPPLVFDTTLVAEAANKGFSYTDASGAPPAITAVAITAPDTVQITLASTPTGANKHLSYAMNQVPNTCVGTPYGARGNVRDSDDTPSRTGGPLYDWAVHFDVDVP